MASQVTAASRHSQPKPRLGVANFFKAARFIAGWITGVIGLGFSITAISAEPCDDLSMPLHDADRTSLAIEIASQIHVDSVSIDQAYHSGDWSVFYVVTNEMDQTFLIYSGEPSKTRYTAVWGGPPTDFSDEQILNWTHKNAKGMPEPLAQCLSWAARQDRPPEP
jgi:hypothetical protein